MHQQISRHFDIDKQKNTHYNNEIFNKTWPRSHKDILYKTSGATIDVADAAFADEDGEFIDAVVVWC